MALLVLRRIGLCFGHNQMCHLCSWLKLFLKNVRWEKIKIQKLWLLGRLSDVSFVPLLYVCFCRSFLLCRLLRLPITVGATRRQGLLPQNPCSKTLSTNITQFFIRSTTALLLGSLSYVLLFYFY